jgi:signal transduction histidine kinase
MTAIAQSISEAGPGSIRAILRRIGMRCGLPPGTRDSLARLGRVLFGGLLLGLGSAGAATHAPQYSIQRWEAGAAEDGLPQNTISAIVQTQDRYLWVGTYSGLARFDGVKFTVFDDSNTPGLASSRVTSLCETADRTLWIGHESGEVSMYREGRFQTVKVAESRSGEKIQKMATNALGDLWLLNAGGALIRLRDGRVLQPESGTISNLVEMARAEDGTLWVARNGRLSVLQGEHCVPLVFAEGLSNNCVLGIAASRSGGVWVETERVRRWHEGRWQEDRGIPPWPGTAMHDLMEMRSGVLAAATSGHGCALIRSSNEPAIEFNREHGFPSDWVVSLYEDVEGNLWVGTGGAGLAVIRTGVFHSVAPPDAWRGRAVLSVYPGADGRLWVGTEGAGLYRKDGDLWRNFTEAEGIGNSYVWSVAGDPQGQLWIGTWNTGLLALRGDRFESAPGLENLATHITSLLPSPRGGLWVGTGEGLVHYAGGRADWAASGGRNPRNDVRAIAETGDGTVWFGTAGSGLGQWKDRALRWIRKPDGLASDYVGCLRVDEEGALWIGTLGGGLNRLKDGRIVTINRVQGLPNGYICHIEDDGRGFFWMASHAGIIRVRKSALRDCADGRIAAADFRAYGVHDGLPTLRCSDGLQPAGGSGADGRLWFSTSRGVVTVDPAGVPDNKLPPPAVVEQVLLDDEPLARTNPSAPLRIPPGRHRIEFRYTGLSFIASDNIRFKHRLAGWEKEWVDAGTKRSVNYNYLPPDDYEFEVMACNTDGVWSVQSARVAFTLLPWFWQTLWFRLLAGLAVVAGAAGAVWFETRRRMHLKLEKLERQRAVEHERSRIARDIHDDLGSNLTQITMLSDPGRRPPGEAGADVQSMDQIHHTAREITRAMDEIVWAVDPHHDTVDSLVSYLEQYAMDFLRIANIRCRLDSPLDLPGEPLSAEARHNLFLAFKEVLNNILKHAAATEVLISFESTPQGFRIVVADNGRGMDPARNAGANPDDALHPGSGNGLSNMQQRLAKAGGSCEITSVPGQGTRVTFSLISHRNPPAGRTDTAGCH